MPKSLTYNADCLEMMREMDDNAFDLAIVDPPYGIGRSGQKASLNNANPNHNRRYHEDKGWDRAIPTVEYFAELRRVSANQIIWGGNYFPLPQVRGWIVWDKGQHGLSMSDGELAWSSFDMPLRIVTINRGYLALESPTTIHPTQKPYRLYKWLLTNYAKQGDKILDTHLGSGSSRIAAYDLGFDFTGIELDQDYFNAQEARFAEHIKQPTFWEQPKAEPMQLAFAV